MTLAASTPPAPVSPPTPARTPAPAIPELLGPPPPTVHVSPETTALQHAEGHAGAAVTRLQRERAALTKRQAAATEAADVAAMQALAAEGRALDDALAVAAVEAARAQAASLSRQVLDDQQVIAPLATYAGKARAIVAEREAALRAAERFYREVAGAAQNAQARCDMLNERWFHAQEAVRATSARLAARLAGQTGGSQDAGPRTPAGRT